VLSTTTIVAASMASREVARSEAMADRGGRTAGVPAVAVTFEVQGKPTIDELALALDKLDGVLGVEATDFADDSG
jgi:hypothetical protein